MAGHVQYMYYFAICLGLFALLTANEWRKWLKLAGVYGTAVLFCWFQVYPAIKYWTNHPRLVEWTYGQAAIFKLPPAYFATLIDRNAMGPLSYVGHLYRGGNFWEFNLYVGPLALAFFGLGLTRFRAYRFAILACSAFVLALGNLTPIYNLCYEYVPFWGSFRGVSKFVFFGVFFGLIVSAFGVDSAGCLIKRHLVKWNKPTTKKAR